MVVVPPDDGLQGLAPPAATAPVGVMPNAAHQKDDAGLLQATNYQLSIVEFDDQGRCYARGQMERIGARLAALSDDRTDAIVVVFVHGWKHDARSNDEDLSHFRNLLDQTSAYEKQHATPGAPPRPVLGVFVGWRGLSAYGVGDAVANATFWDRQTAGHRVATGSVRELFGRLRNYRNTRRDAGGRPLLVIAGHSFGGMIVYSALAQSLVEAACAPSNVVVPSFADLVLLLNPALEASRFLPIYDLVTSPGFKARSTTQLPIFVCVQARNDQPVGTWFPIGNVGRKLDEATIGELERDCLTHAMGFVAEFRTHRLEGPAGAAPFVLTPGDIRQANPFWVVDAAAEVVDGHGGIWGLTFLQFLVSIVFARVAESKRAEGPKGPPSAAARPGDAAPREAVPDLASFAQALSFVPLGVAPPRSGS